MDLEQVPQYYLFVISFSLLRLKLKTESRKRVSTNLELLGRFVCITNLMLTLRFQTYTNQLFIRLLSTATHQLA